MQNQLLWLNKSITINSKPILWQKWYDKGIVFMHDLLNEKSDFLTADQIENKFGIECNFLTALQIRQSIPLSWRKKLSTVSAIIKYNFLQIFVEQKDKFIIIGNISSKMFFLDFNEKSNQNTTMYSEMAIPTTDRKFSLEKHLLKPFRSVP